MDQRLSARNGLPIGTKMKSAFQRAASRGRRSTVGQAGRAPAWRPPSPSSCRHQVGRRQSMKVPRQSPMFARDRRTGGFTGAPWAFGRLDCTNSRAVRDTMSSESPRTARGLESPAGRCGESQPIEMAEPVLAVHEGAIDSCSLMLREPGQSMHCPRGHAAGGWRSNGRRRQGCVPP